VPPLSIFALPSMKTDPLTVSVFVVLFQLSVPLELWHE